MKQHSFEKLEVWQSCRKFICEIYHLTSKFPDEEKFGLTNPIRRASVSISSNLVEGNYRISPKDKARFTEIAYSSSMEVLSQLFLSCHLGFINDVTLQRLKTALEEITNKLNSLRNYQLNTN